MANVRKRISDLTALTSASLDTTIVGVDGGTTYKIELDTLADAVTSRVNILDRSRLSALESVTSSYETKGSSIVSSSTQIISLGFVSSSTLNSYTSSQSTLNTAFQIAIEGRLQTSSFNSFSSSVNTRIIAATNEQSFNGLISGSSQLTSSYDTRYAASASYLTSLNGAISSSVQVLGGSGVLSGSTSVPAGTVSGSSQLTSSYDARYLTIGGDGVISGSSQITGIVNLTNLSATSQVSASVFVGGFGVAEAKYTVISSKPMTFYPNPSIEAVRFTTNGGVIIGKNGEVNDFGNKLDVSGSVRFIGNTTITGSVISTVGITGSIAATNGVISGSSQLTSSYDNRYSLSGSVLTSFSSSVDTRLDTLEASIITGSVNYVQTLGARVTSVTTTGVTIITGSITTTGNPVQIMVTGDANPVNVLSWTRLQIYRDSTAIGNIVHVENSSNLNVPYCVNVIDTPSAGTYTYSMRTVSGHSGTFDFGESTGPTLTAVELKTNTNLPSTNNTFTGNNTFNGTTRFETVGGDEGGEFEFGVPQTNTTLSTRVAVDIFQNKFRIFDGNTKGAYLNIASQSVGVGSEIVTSPNVSSMQTITSASYAALTPVSGTLYIIIG